MAELKVLLQLSYSFLTLKHTSKFARVKTVELFYCVMAYSSVQQCKK